MAVLSLKTLTASQMADFVAEQGWPRFRTRQLLAWMYQRGVTRFDQMSDVGKTERLRLEQLAVIVAPEVIDVRRDPDDGTEKLLLRLEDGQTVESVLIPDDDRLTLCLSTQVGCTLDCGFCLTGTMGLTRNLKAHEIVEQVLTAQDRLDSGERITNLEFMGMGEPLANMEALAEAIRRLINKPWGLGV